MAALVGEGPLHLISPDQRAWHIATRTTQQPDLSGEGGDDSQGSEERAWSYRSPKPEAR